MVELNESTVYSYIIICVWADYLWSIYLSWRQYKLVQKPVEFPPEALKKVMDNDILEKARLYLKTRLEFGMIQKTISILLTTLGLYRNILFNVWVFSEGLTPYKSEVIVSCIWVAILMTIETLLSLPMAVYYTFVLEEKFGFNKQTVRFFIIDRLKDFIMSQCLALVMNSITVIIIKYTGNFFFLWLWIGETLIGFIMMEIYPFYIAPLFDEYTSLPEGDLRTEITKIASDLKFPLTEIYVVDGSKRSSHSNAYFTGLFNSKRIVLFDTLLSNPEMNNNAIIAVLCHEFGHWHYGHITKQLVMVEMDFLATCLIYSALFQSPLIYKTIGFSGDVKPVLVGLLVIINYLTIWYGLLVSFFTTYMSRRFEFQADAFAAKLGRAQDLKRALVQLSKDNLDFPIYDWLYSDWYHSHPPLLERMNALDYIK